MLNLCVKTFFVFSLFIPEISSGFVVLLDPESQNGWGCKGPLEVIWPKVPAKALSPRAGCPGPCPDGCSVSPRMIVLKHSSSIGTSLHFQRLISQFKGQLEKVFNI